MSDQHIQNPQWYQHQLVELKRLIRLAELWYRRWRFEQHQAKGGTASTRQISWENLKKMFEGLNDIEFEKQLRQLHRVAESATRRAQEIWEPTTVEA